jgi:hypothetical protein
LQAARLHGLTSQKIVFLIINHDKNLRSNLFITYVGRAVGCHLLTMVVMNVIVQMVIAVAPSHARVRPNFCSVQQEEN